MSSSARLGLPFVEAAQSQKHVTVNETVGRLDALVQASVKSRSHAAQPAMPAAGECYVLAAARTGADWGAMPAGAIASFADGAWTAIAPRAGFRAYIEDEALFAHFDGAAWVADSSGASGAATFGVNTAADATNRLAVKSNAALFSHDDVTPGTGDARIIVNKQSAAKTGSVVFQDNFSGRAEFGLNGADDFSLKVSANGSAWTNAILIDRTNGNVAIGAASAALRLVVDGGSMSVSNGSSNAYLSFGSNNFSTGYIAWLPASNRITLWAVPTGSEIRLGTENAARMTVTANGNVGIGTTTPAVKLDIDGPARVKAYAKASLPSASAGAGQMIFVSDEAGGAVIAFSDGSSWRRVTDRAVVS